MLGARARAAEYNAYKAATARQASREAEEQKLPPKPSPISLSAFTRNPLSNRNKGNKTWVPLILEDTREVDVDDDDDDGHNPPDYHVMSTPSPSRQTSHSSSHGIDPTAKPPLPPVRELQRPLRINFPDGSARVARRSHLQHQDYPAPLLNPTPQRVLPHFIIQQSQSHQSLPVNMHDTSGNYAPFTWYPIPNQSWSNGLQSFHHPAQVPVPSSSHAFQQGSFMVPDDISPAKQENKLVNLSQAYDESPFSFGPVKQPFSATPNLDNDPIFPQYTSSHHGTAPPVWDLPQELLDETRRHLQPLVSRQSDSDGFTPLREQLSGHATQPGLFSTKQTQDEPYDRRSNMQNFVAAQQALARTGKTVLHNPEWHRSKLDGNPPDISTTDTSHSPSEQNSYEEPRRTSMLRKSLLSMKPPPGLESQLDSGAAIISKPTTRGTTKLGQDNAQETFNIGSPGWLELRPVTKLERTWMIRMMRSCSRVENVDRIRALDDGLPSIRSKVLKTKVEDMNPDDKMARRALNQIANDYFLRRLSQLTNINGSISSSDSAMVKMETVSIGAIGDILANIKASSDLSGSEDDHVGYFCKYKPAPEYAVERGRLLGGNTGSCSFFEEETGGFYNAPSRIARDRRFRPASKEGLKSKVDDEWKYRHDLYGRRRL